MSSSRGEFTHSPSRSSAPTAMSPMSEALARAEASGRNGEELFLNYVRAKNAGCATEAGRPRLRRRLYHPHLLHRPHRSRCTHQRVSQPRLLHHPRARRTPAMPGQRRFLARYSLRQSSDRSPTRRRRGRLGFPPRQAGSATPMVTRAQLSAICGGAWRAAMCSRRQSCRSYVSRPAQ